MHALDPLRLERGAPEVRLGALASGLAMAQLAGSLSCPSWGGAVLAGLAVALLVRAWSGAARSSVGALSRAALVGGSFLAAVTPLFLAFPSESELRMLSSGSGRRELAVAVASDPRYSRSGELTFIGVVVSRGSVAAPRVLVRAPDLPWYPLADVRRGDTVRAAFRIRPIASSPLDPPSPFSFEGHLWRHGIAAVGDVGRNVERISSSSAIRATALGDRLVSGTSGASRGIGVMLAGAAGDESYLDGRTEILFRRTGLTHLLVVSGYHVAVVFGALRSVLLRLSGGLAKRARVDVIASVGSLIGTTVYGSSIGLDPTVGRALLGLAVIVCGRLLCRRARRASLLFAVLIANILVFPGCVFEPGTQLTFAALAGLYCAGAIIDERRLLGTSARSPLAERVIAAALLNSLAFLGTLPVTILWFAAFPIAAAAFNLFVGFLFTVLVVMCGGVLLIVELLLPGSMLRPIESVAGVVELMLEALERVNGTLGGELVRVEDRTGGAVLVVMLLAAGYGAVLLDRRSRACSGRR